MKAIYKIFKDLRIAICALLVSFIVASFTIPAYAYSTCGYRLKGTWYDDYYYVSAKSVTYNGTTVNYGTIANSAVRAWNNAVNSSTGHSLDIALTETTNGSATTTRVVISPLDRGNTGWRGFTYYYGYNSITGEWYTINYGGYPTKNYQSGSAVINLTPFFH